MASVAPVACFDTCRDACRDAKRVYRSSVTAIASLDITSHGIDRNGDVISSVSALFPPVVPRRPFDLMKYYFLPWPFPRWRVGSFDASDLASLENKSFFFFAIAVITS